MSEATQTTTQDAIAQAVAMAQAKANQTPAVQNTALAPTMVAGGKPRTLADALASAGANVEGWVTASEDGMKYDKGKLFTTPFEAVIDLQKVLFNFSCRFTTGAGTTFIKSYDGGTTDSRTGEPWQQALAKARQMDPKCNGQYDAAEVPMTLVKDLTHDAAKPALPAGKVIGYATPVTGYKPFISWLGEAVSKYGEHAQVRVRVSHAPQERKGFKWGLVSFETLGVAE